MRGRGLAERDFWLLLERSDSYSLTVSRAPSVRLLWAPGRRPPPDRPIPPGLSGARVPVRDETAGRGVAVPVRQRTATDRVPLAPLRKSPGLPRVVSQAAIASWKMLHQSEWG